MDIKFYKGTVKCSGSPSIFCIACMNGMDGSYDNFIISYEKQDVVNYDFSKKWLNYLNNIGFDFELTESEASCSAVFRTSIYNSYTKGVAVLCLFRCIFDKYSGLGIIKEMSLLERQLPELSMLELYQLAHFVTTSKAYGIDRLHHPISRYTKLVNEDTFKANFMTCNRLTNMFDSGKEIDPRNAIKYINNITIDDNKTKLLKLIL